MGRAYIYKSNMFVFTPTITPTATITPTITVTPTISPTIIPPIIPRNEIVVFPHPGREKVKLIVSFKGQGKVQARMYNIAGEIVLSLDESCQEQNGNVLLELNTENLASGVYLLELSIEDAQGKRKIIKKVCIAK